MLRYYNSNNWHDGSGLSGDGQMVFSVLPTAPTTLKSEQLSSALRCGDYTLFEQILRMRDPKSDEQAQSGSSHDLNCPGKRKRPDS